MSCYFYLGAGRLIKVTLHTFHFNKWWYWWEDLAWEAETCACLTNNSHWAFICFHTVFEKTQGVFSFIFLLFNSLLFFSSTTTACCVPSVAIVKKTHNWKFYISVYIYFFFKINEVTNVTGYTKGWTALFVDCAALAVSISYRCKATFPKKTAVIVLFVS